VETLTKMFFQQLNSEHAFEPLFCDVSRCNCVVGILAMYAVQILLAIQSSLERIWTVLLIIEEWLAKLTG